MPFLVEPTNAAVLLGVQAIFQCAIPSGPSSGISWQFKPHTPGSSFRNIVNNCESADANIYDVRKGQGEGVCDLIVKRPSSQEAGVYICHATIDGRREVFSAGLTVLEGEPDCTQSATSGSVGDKITIACAVRYASLRGPVINAKIPDTKANITNKVGFNVGLNTFTSTIILTKEPVQPIEYDVKFTLAYPDVDAKNIEDFQYKWTSDTIYAHYPPTSEDLVIKTSTGNKELRYGDTISCSSEVRPNPKFWWINGHNNETTQGATFKVPLVYVATW